MAKYSKAIVAALALFGTLATSLFGIGEETVQQVIQAILAVAGTFGVYQVANA